MTILEYEAQFYVFLNHAIAILLIEHERVRCFVRGLRFSICTTTQSLVSFIEAFDYTQTKEEIYCEA